MNKFARFCRWFSIDELPQLPHIVRGEMSLIAPHPLTAGEFLRVKPGITGLWQVAGRSRLSYRQRGNSTWRGIARCASIFRFCGARYRPR